jgi:hypothetical protein
LAIALLARYLRHITGAWRCIYAVNVVISLYLNVFVLVAQLFQKIPALKSLAPTQSEPPFVIAQLAVMALFTVLGVFAVKRLHIERLDTPVMTERCVEDRSKSNSSDRRCGGGKSPCLTLDSKPLKRRLPNLALISLGCTFGQAPLRSKRARAEDRVRKLLGS